MSKTLIFIIIGVVLLAGGAVLVLQQLEIGPFASDTTGEASPEIDGNEAKKKTVELSTVPIEALFIPIIRKGKVALNLELVIQIETPKKREAALREKLPILKDAYIQDLFSYIPRQLRKKKELDQATLKRRLEIVGDRKIGKGYISSIVIKEYSEAAPVSSQSNEESDADKQDVPKQQK